MKTLVTIEEVKAYLGIADTDTASDKLLQNLSVGVSAWVERYCDRQFKSDTYTEQHDGCGLSEIQVDQYPIISVTSVHDDSERGFGADTLIATTDYVFYANTGTIRLDGGIFTKGIQNLKVIYDAGYAKIPTDLAHAVVSLIADRFRNKEHQGVQSMAIGSYKVTYTNEEIPGEIRSILDSYRRLAIA